VSLVPAWRRRTRRSATTGSWATATPARWCRRPARWTGCVCRGWTSGSYFGRLLDRERGGWCAVTPADPAAAFSRRYLDGALVLQTDMTAVGGRVRVTDCLTMRPGGARRPYRQLLRVVDGLDGALDLRVEIVPRFDYGQVRPWLRRAGPAWQALGGDDGLVIEGDVPLALSGLHDLVSSSAHEDW
jgi:hypothetical protein